MVPKFVKRVASLSAAFFMISSLSRFDSPVQGYEGADVYDFEENTIDEVANQDVAQILDYVVEGDGFMIKPNLTANEVGDRSTANEGITYIVKAGDTVASIAANYDIKDKTIMMTNGFYDVNQLKEGMTITVLPVDGVQHKVQKGDTLSAMAKKYKVSETDIRRQNQLEEDSTIVPGMALIIPGGEIEVLPPAPPKPAYVPNNKRPGNNNSNKNAGGNTGSAFKSTDYVYDGPTPTGGYIFPAPNGCRDTQGFKPGHYAIDCANKAGGPIVAMAKGVVIKASASGYGGGYGIHAIVQHPDGSQSLYAHFRDIYVVTGQTVEQGEALGFMGTTGRSTGVHLHLEFRTKDGRKLNPRSLF